VARDEQAGSRHQDRALDRGRESVEGFFMRRLLGASRSFTLVEILVVISIIGLLAGIAVPTVGGALAAARKAKVATMAQQIRTAITQFNTEYGYFPTNGLAGGSGIVGADLALILTGDTNSAVATNANVRRIAFLEVPPDFTFNAAGNLSNRGIVTPRGFWANNQQREFFVAVDHNYDGTVTVTNDGRSTNIRATVAVWFVDARATNKTVGTWR
jgi:prepilin-type N-terminal cleavage/methylation domain-containing protein